MLTTGNKSTEVIISHSCEINISHKIIVGNFLTRFSRRISFHGVSSTTCTQILKEDPIFVQDFIKETEKTVKSERAYFLMAII